MLDGRELGGCPENAHVVELVEEEVFVLAPGGVMGGEKREAVGQLAEALSGWLVLDCLVGSG